jgi:hypothetical protein
MAHLQSDHMTRILKAPADLAPENSRSNDSRVSIDEETPAFIHSSGDRDACAPSPNLSPLSRRGERDERTFSHSSLGAGLSRMTENVVIPSEVSEANEVEGPLFASSRREQYRQERSLGFAALRSG